ncbi:ABC transporter ATP-binding protein [Erysipelothrix sp. HDW6C]|uniref:ABC transporter ATP-binding protein n=1 Tax=Erysipelothrix sp. HDW6C TaxID=2714930 RepID=UPI0014085164|nr:ABC transporter ATP-binding protein [Erysipelothrix sp. HDW6C]QIK69311.1 ABC transporter ATP-binding protein [Erysipelothrix sp. HDW6C]
MEILNVMNLSKIYKQGKHEVKALDDVSFKVNKGEFVAIMGPSGSGKSTLLHMIGCVDTASSGYITIDGLAVDAFDEEKLTIFRRRHIGLVYQFYNLIPILNIEDNIKLPILLDQAPIDIDYYQDLVTRLNLKDRLTHLPSQLSGGQQQRVSIARALMNRPSLLLADEPTGNLDQANSQEILEMLKASHREDKQTIMLITHDENIAMQADRIIHIEDGRITRDEVIL